jgi:outer membrane protein assembly factor BamA
VPTGLAQQPAGAKLVKVEFEGTKHLTQTQLLTASGLEIGQPTTIKALDSAGQRLMDSGLLKKLSYRLRTVNNEATVIFKIEEAAGLKHPAIFDNFVWFSDEELSNAVRHDVPTFDGNALDDGNMTDEITRSLQLLLTTHKLPGKVEYMASANASGNLAAHVFTVRGVKLPICSLHFPGAKNVSEERLVAASKDLLLESYSRQITADFALNTLFPVYREVGQLRAKFGQAMGRTGPADSCKDGVEVAIPVDEGIIYSWENAEWSGNQIFPAEELDRALNMKPGVVANGKWFDQGLEAVDALYGSKGYLQLELKPTAVFDDQASKVSYRIEVKEGPQYHMGLLVVKGLPDNQTNYLRGKWEMLKGDVYDAGYAKEFFKHAFQEVNRKITEERQLQGKPRLDVAPPREEINRADLTVNVTFEFAEKKEP